MDLTVKKQITVTAIKGTDTKKLVRTSSDLKMKGKTLYFDGKTARELLDEEGLHDYNIEDIKVANVKEKENDENHTPSDEELEEMEELAEKEDYFNGKGRL